MFTLMYYCCIGFIAVKLAVSLTLSVNRQTNTVEIVGLNIS